MPFLQKSYESLDTLAEAIGQAIRAPVTIENTYHQLLAYSTHPDSTDPARIATIIGRRVPEPVVADLWQSGILNELVEHDTPIVIPARSAIGLGERAAIAIKHHHEVLGYIWSLARNEPFSDHELSILTEGAKIAKKLLMTIAMHERRIDAKLEQFFLEVLSARQLSTPQREQLDEIAPLAVASRLMLLEFHHAVTPNDLEQIQYILVTDSPLQTILYASEGPYVYVWFYLNVDLAQETLETNEWSARFKQRLDTVLPNTIWTIGISRRFFNSDTLTRAHDEVKSLVTLRKRFPFELRTTILYDQIGLFQLIPPLSEQAHTRLEPHPLIDTLRDYDRKQQTELLRTLENYLYFERNVKAVAAHLHVHPNTILYRIRRIEELVPALPTTLPEQALLYLQIKANQFHSEE